MKSFDLIIIGAGPAGLTAGIFASRYKTNHLVLGEAIGGIISTAHKVGNFPTEIDISGVELAQKIVNSAKHYEVKIENAKVKLIKKEKNRFLIILEKGESYQSKAIILATGTKRRRLELEKEKEIKGISYCATCDGFFYQGKIVGVVGGGNSALTSAIYLADIAKKVYLICREKDKNEFRAETIWVDNLLANKKIEILWQTNVKKLKEKNKALYSVKIDKNYKGKDEIELDGLFIAIGVMPTLPKIEGMQINLAPDGSIKIDQTCATNIKGFFAAGDLTDGSNRFRQAITACSEGAIAADSVHKYLKENF